MKVRNLVIFIIIILLILACTYVVFFGLAFGVKEFTPLRAVRRGLDLTGGVTIVYEASDNTVEDLDTKIEGAMDIFRTRLDNKGFTEATITRQGEDRIRVEVPINESSEIQDPSEIVDFIGKPAQLQFLRPDGSVIVEGDDIVSAEPMMDNAGNYIVQIEMSSEGGDIFAEATRELVKASSNYVTITLDGELISEPRVTEVISGGIGQISSPNFTQQEVSELAMQIESGALPIELNVLEESQVSATLGDDALNRSILAGIIGLSLLLIFMAVVYRVPGLMADIALIAYTTIVIFLIALFEIQLTLPGIAGIVLGIGMAVDANVVIFSRMKEEYYNGYSIRAAVKTGFKKAATAIIDSNVTTLIAAIVLAIYGTGAIKGFAYTLAISIVVSLFTALVVAQALLRLLVNIAPGGTKMYFSAKKNKDGGEQK